MNILYLTNIFSDRAGGSEYVFWLYAKYMARRGHRVYVVSFAKDPSSMVRLGDSARNIEIIELSPGNKHKGVLFHDLKSNINYIINGINIIKRLINMIDIIHSNTYIPALLGSIAKGISVKPHIVTIHDVATMMGIRFLYNWFREADNNRIVSTVKTLAAITFEKSLSTSVLKDAVIVPSNQTMKDLILLSNNKINDRIYIIPNFIDEEIYEIYKNKFKIEYNPCILYIGRLVSYKNIHIIIKEFSKVIKMKKDAKLLVIGKGPLGALLREWVHRHGLASNIIFLGNIEQEIKLKFISKCTALINLSLFEGFGITILESWFYEKPVIVSDIPPLNEIVRNNYDGIVINIIKNRNSLIDNIIYLIENKKIAQRMGYNGYKKLIRYYSSKKVIEILEHVYYSMISQQR